MDKKPSNPAYRDALAMLARRDHTTHELKQKLNTKGHGSELVETAVSHLNAQGLLNDNRYIENFIHFRRNKGYGPERIRQELIHKGTDPEAIAEQLDIADNNWSVAARKLWQKHFKGVYPDNFKDKARQMRFLQYRGFTTEQLRSVFDDEEIV